MANSSRRLRSAFERSISPTGRCCNTMAATDATSFASYRTSSFYSSPSAGCFNRSASPTRVNLHALAPVNSTPSVKFFIDRSSSPRRSVAVSQRDQVVRKQIPKRTCLCSPTTHPGSFRCSMHKNMRNTPSISYSPSRLNARRSAMTNSLVRIWSVEGDLVKRALAALIRPSSHHQRRRGDFQPRPSRLSRMSKVGEFHILSEAHLLSFPAMASDSGCCFYYSDEKEAMAILIHFCVSRRVWRSSFHYALAFPVRSPYLRSTCFSICSSSFVQGLGFIFRFGIFTLTRNPWMGDGRWMLNSSDNEINSGRIF